MKSFAVLVCVCAAWLSGCVTVTHPKEEFMELRGRLTELVGEWQGQNSLWLMPGDPARESEAKVSITSEAGGRFIAIRCSWADGDTPHDGLMLVRNGAEPSREDIVWVDSFHTAGGFMHFPGQPDDEGGIHVHTTYPAPPGPDWGWRMFISADSADAFRIVMYNIMPDGQEVMAVDLRCTRVGG